MNWWKLYLVLIMLLALFSPARGIFIVFYAVAVVYWGAGRLKYAFSRVGSHPFCPTNQTLSGRCRGRFLLPFGTAPLYRWRGFQGMSICLWLWNRSGKALGDLPGPRASAAAAYSVTGFQGSAQARFGAGGGAAGPVSILSHHCNCPRYRCSIRESTPCRSWVYRPGFPKAICRPSCPSFPIQPASLV